MRTPTRAALSIWQIQRTPQVLDAELGPYFGEESELVGGLVQHCF